MASPLLIVYRVLLSFRVCGQNTADRESSSGTVTCAYTCTVLICTIHLLQIDNATFLVREQFRVFLVVLVFLREEVIQVGIEVQRNINLVLVLLYFLLA